MRIATCCQLAITMGVAVAACWNTGCAGPSRNVTSRLSARSGTDSVATSFERSPQLDSVNARYPNPSGIDASPAAYRYPARKPAAGCGYG